MGGRRSRGSVLGLLLVGVLVGCTRPQRAAPQRAEEEASVRPGVNANYFEEPDPDRWAARFEREDREVFAHREEIVARIAPRPGAVIADVGAGTGAFEELFSRAVGPSGRVVAVDIVPEFLDHIRREARERGLENVATHLGGERSIGLDRESVDLVFVCDTYHHFEYPQSMLASIREALRPGGQLVIVDFAREEGKSGEWILRHVRAGEDEVAREIEAAGFEPVERGRVGDGNYLLRFRRP